MAAEVNKELSDFLAQFECESLAEVQALTDQFMHAKNEVAVDDFLGLTPTEVHHLLHPVFHNDNNSTDFCCLSEKLSSEPNAPILCLVNAIVDAVEATDTKGLKATATGKLPQQLCKNAFVEYRELIVDHLSYQFLKVNKEDDFLDLQVARLVMEIAGLLRRTKGHFHLTQKYKKLVAKAGNKSLFPVLFKTYCSEFNWAYCDRYGDMPFVQQSCLFSLYMLSAMGHVKQAESVYIDTFLKAFPMVINELEYDYDYISLEEQAGNCYALRVIQRYFWFMGLVSIEMPQNNRGQLANKENDQLIRKLPLFDELITFSPLS